ncbi:MAG: Hsp20/alpha crystallin family protein [Oscillospiraceae bacterium]|nr:Hsp20/alpha crystallin family protein [Oscillospiraceae bacterium]
MLFPEVFGRNNFDAFDDFFNDSFDRQFGRPHRMPPHPPVQVMKTDVKETDTGYELAVDLPGVKKENVKAEINDGYLTISATTETNNDQQDENGKYIRRERFSGSYSRSFYVGRDVTEADIKAKFTDGVLKLDIPKKEPSVPEKKYISIDD